MLKSSYTEILKRSVVIFSSILVTLILLEISLRFIQFLGNHQLLGLTPSRTTLSWINNPEVGNVIFKSNSEGWFVSPTHEYFSYININSQGFRDNDHQLKKPVDNYRIAILGDSFVQSLQVPLDKTFFKQLESNLKISNKKVEVLSFGMGNTGTAQQLALLPEVLKYQPDLVIQMFLTANDFKNNSPKLNNDPKVTYFKIEDNNLTKIPPQLHENPLKTNLENLRIVELFLFMRQKVQETQANKQFDYPLDYHVYDKNYNLDFQDSAELTKVLIKESQKQTEISGAKYVLVSLANNEQVNTAVWSGLTKKYPKLLNVNLDKPDEILADICVTNKTDCLFMLPYFKNYLQKNPAAVTHYKYDGHWNQLGNNLAAQFLLENLSSIILN